MDSEVGQVAIVGMAVLLPGADSLKAFWDNIVSGYDAITAPPPGRWEPEFYDPEASGPDRVYCRRGGFLEKAEFDALQFGVVPSTIRDTEPEQLIALRVAAAAIADAGGPEQLPAPERTGVIVGRGGYGSVAQANFLDRVRLATQIREVLRQILPDLDRQRLEAVSSRINESFGPFQPENVIGLTPSLTASLLANRLDLGGPAYTVDAACASSLIAVSNGLAELRSGRLDAVLAGGVHHLHSPSFWSLFCQLGAMSRRGEIRPFDKAADGMLIGEATGMVLLKRLPDAIRQGDRIYAVIRGAGTSSDGRSSSLFNPDMSGQALAIQRAWAEAGIDPASPDSLGMLEAHGTGTPTGDATELASLAAVFGGACRGPRPVIGSVKSMVGHTITAAGIVGLIKAALAVASGVLPPTLHCDDPHPLLEKTRFAPISSARPWTGPGPRRAGVNAFGFGGINAHIILEEPPAAPSSRPGAYLVHEPGQMIMLAAPSMEAMSALLDAGDELIRERSRRGLAEAASDRCRLVIAEPKARSIAIARQLAAKGEAWRGGADIWLSPRPLLAAGAGQVAFVFPGLERDFRPRLEGITQRLGVAADDPGQPLSPGVDVMRTGLLMHDALRRLGITPDALAGYSVGEWTAWAAAGIAERQVLYQLAARESATTEVSAVMIATGCPDIEKRLPRYPGVALSVDSAPDLSVVCGPADQVSRLVADASREGIVYWPLPFRAGYHTEYYAAAAQALNDRADLRPRRGRVPVWSATLAGPCPGDPAQLRSLFFRHLVERVRFRDTIRAMHKAGIRAFIQAGPGHLASVMHQTLRDLDHLTIAANVSHRDGASQLTLVAAALWAEGLTPDPGARGTAGPASARSLARRRGQPVRLELDSPRLSLGADAARMLGAPPPAVMTSSGIPAAVARLRAASSPGAAEFAELLEDTAVTVASVLATGPDPQGNEESHG
jgi:acyl transferase domain-containing protein